MFMVGYLPLFAQIPSIKDPPPLLDADSFQTFVRPSSPDQEIFLLRFPSPIWTNVLENNTVEALVVLPRERVGAIPVVVLLHFWGALDLKYEERIARQLNINRIGAVIVTLPYHLNRCPAGYQSGELALKADTQHLVQAMTQSVQDVRRVLDWVVTQSWADHSRIGVSGISLGAIVASISYSVDERIKQGAFLFGGADLAFILWNSSVTIRTRMEFRQQGYTEEKLRNEIASVEPEQLARKSEQELLIVGARYDDVVPPETTRKLAESHGVSKIVWLDTGHYGGALAERRVSRLVVDFFSARFSERSFDFPQGIGAPTIRLGLQYNVNHGFTFALGLDLWRSAPSSQMFVSGLVSPKGISIYGGRSISYGFSAGLVFTGKHVVPGLFWSIVL
jgi:dienelactone hydrolase